MTETPKAEDDQPTPKAEDDQPTPKTEDDQPLTSHGGAYRGDLTDHTDPDHAPGGKCIDCDI